MKVIALTGGGTAGHVTPNIALMPELKKRNYNIIYIGSINGMEKDMIEPKGIPFFGINCDKLRRYHDFKNFLTPLNVLRGIGQAKKILRENKVDVVFSKGGYVAVPVVIAAHSLKIPVISHEADITPGLANKIARPFSKYICTNFEETAKLFGKKGVYTGSPIREQILKGDAKKGYEFLGFNDDKPIVFVTGGSLGSRYINNLIRSNLDKLLPYVNIVHSCGKGNLTNIDREGYRQYEVIKEEMPDVLMASDLVISRAGANIIFEILAVKKLNLLIPLSKKASRGDQILNAQNFESKKYSVVLYEEDQEKDSDSLYKRLKEIKERQKELMNALNNSKASDANKKICDLIDNVIK